MSRSRFLFSLVSLFAILFAVHFELETRPTLEVHIVAGQSNAMGYAGRGAYYPPDFGKVDETIPFFYECPGIGNSSGDWVTLGPQEGMSRKGYFGPEVTFGRALLAAGGRPAIFKFTGPSKSIAKDWKGPGDGGMYDEMCRSLGDALKLLEKNHKKYKIVSFTWIQGESDAETDDMSSHYEERLSLLLEDFRKFVNEPELVILLGVDEQHPWVKERPQVVAVQQGLVRKGHRMAFVSMVGLVKADTSHLTPAGLIDHGKRLFDAYEKVAIKGK